jgi:hypothetical protein
VTAFDEHAKARETRDAVSFMAIRSGVASRSEQHKPFYLQPPFASLAM